MQKKFAGNYRTYNNKTRRSKHFKYQKTNY